MARVPGWHGSEHATDGPFGSISTPGGAVARRRVAAAPTTVRQRSAWGSIRYSPVLPHFHAVQPRQQDQRRQAGGEEGDRATRDDSHDPVAPGELIEESGDPRHRFGRLRVGNDGRQSPVEVAENPRPRRITPKRCKHITGVEGHGLDGNGGTRGALALAASAASSSRRGGADGAEWVHLRRGRLPPMDAEAAASGAMTPVSQPR